MHWYFKVSKANEVTNTIVAVGVDVMIAEKDTLHKGCTGSRESLFVFTRRSLKLTPRLGWSFHLSTINYNWSFCSNISMSYRPSHKINTIWWLIFHSSSYIETSLHLERAKGSLQPTLSVVCFPHDAPLFREDNASPHAAQLPEGSLEAFPLVREFSIHYTRCTMTAGQGIQLFQRQRPALLPLSRLTLHC